MTELVDPSFVRFVQPDPGVQVFVFAVLPCSWQRMLTAYEPDVGVSPVLTVNDTVPDEPPDEYVPSA